MQKALCADDFVLDEVTIADVQDGRQLQFRGWKELTQRYEDVFLGCKARIRYLGGNFDEKRRSSKRENAIPDLCRTSSFLERGEV